MSQAELARQAQLSPTTVNRLMRKPTNSYSGDTVVAIAQVLGREDGEEFLRLAGLLDLVESLGGLRREGQANSLSYGGAPLSPAQEAEARQWLDFIRQRDGR